MIKKFGLAFTILAATTVVPVATLANDETNAVDASVSVFETASTEAQQAVSQVVNDIVGEIDTGVTTTSETTTAEATLTPGTTPPTEATESSAVTAVEIDLSETTEIEVVDTTTPVDAGTDTEVDTGSDTTTTTVDGVVTDTNTTTTDVVEDVTESEVTTSDGSDLPVDQGSTESTEIDTGSVVDSAAPSNSADTSTETVESAPAEPVQSANVDERVQPLAQTGIESSALLWATLALAMGVGGIVYARRMKSGEQL